MGYQLPTELDIDTTFIDHEIDVEDALSDYLSDEYGFCVNTFDYEYDVHLGMYHVTNIDWDLED